MSPTMGLVSRAQQLIYRTKAKPPKKGKDKKKKKGGGGDGDGGGKVSGGGGGGKKSKKPAAGQQVNVCSYAEVLSNWLLFLIDRGYSFRVILVQA